MKRMILALLAATVLLMAGCGAVAEEQKAETPVITGTWATASWGYEYYGKSQAEYYVQFTDSEIVYLHENGDTLVPIIPTGSKASRRSVRTGTGSRQSLRAAINIPIRQTMTIRTSCVIIPPGMRMNSPMNTAEVLR